MHFDGTYRPLLAGQLMTGIGTAQAVQIIFC